MILGLPLPPAILQPPIPIAPSHVEDFSLSRLGSSYSLSRTRFFFAPPFSRRPVPRSPVASYIELPPRTPPFRANSKAIRMASGTTYTKTKNFFVARTGMPVHFSVRAFIDRVSLCVDALSRAVPRLPSSFCISYTACSSIVCPRVVIYADVATYADRDLIYVKRILTAKKDVT